MRLKNLHHPDLLKNPTYNFIVPIGSTEQHGPFLPFGTDTYITDYLIDQVEKQFPDLVILPTLEFSRAQEHRGFFGTIYLTEETLQKVLHDICHSLYTKANHIFIISFHYNDLVIQKFIKENTTKFAPAKLVHLEIFNDEDEAQIEKLLNGPSDGHAGNTEISNMLAINPSLVNIPTKNDPKQITKNAFSTDNLIEKSPNGIVDNHPDWIVNKERGQEILDIYEKRIIRNLNLE